MSNSLTALWVGESTKICHALALLKQLAFLSVLDKREVTAPPLCPLPPCPDTPRLARHHHPQKYLQSAGRRRS